MWHRKRFLFVLCGAVALALSGAAAADDAAGRHGAPPARHAAGPTMPGQSAFGALQEIVQLLEAEPGTDWSRVNLAGLREHLIDMDEVTLRAAAAEAPVEGGLQIDVTGAGRTLEAIQRLIPAQGGELDGLNGWSSKTEALPAGVRLTVTASDPKQAAHIRGLGFAGLLATGAHHQPHHLALALGDRRLH